MMYTKEQLAKSIAKPDYRSEQVATFQNAGQIVKTLLRAEYNSRATSKRLAQAFKDSSKMKEAAKVWLFLRSQIKYKAEPTSRQTGKTINRLLVQGKGDCKHYATFAVGVLNALGIPAWFSFAGQDPTKRKPNHAYASALIDGKVVTIDPCRRQFNTECKHFYKWDVQPLKTQIHGSLLSERRPNHHWALQKKKTFYRRFQSKKAA